MNLAPRRHRRLGLVAAAAAGALVLAGCAGGGSTGGGNDAGGAGLPYDAAPEEFAAALEDMEPVNLIYQTSAASEETASGGPRAVAFKNRVEEYSGGKITIEIVWASGISAGAENDNALSDGRIDMDSVFPIYEPSEYPIGAIVNDLAMTNPGTVIAGTLSGGAAVVEYGLKYAPFAEEMLEQGIHLVLPLSGTAPLYIICKEPVESLAGFAGKQIRVSGTAHTREIEALGAVPVSLPYNEVYEGLQRGIVDCATQNFTTAYGAGTLEVAPFVHYSPDVTLANAVTAPAYGEKVASLPVEAQQIVFDALYENWATSLRELWDIVYLDLIDAINNEYGGGFVELDADTVAAIKSANDAMLAEYAATPAYDASSLPEDMAALQEKWAGIVAELGYSDGGPLADFTEWYTPGSVDLQPWLDSLYEEVLNDVRPGHV